MTETQEQAVARQREVLQRVADALAERRLAAGAILLLESVKPLSFIASQGMVFLEPILQPLLSVRDYRVFAEAIESRENLEWLIQRLEESEEGRREPRGASSPDR